MTSECPYGNKAYHWQTVDVEHLLYNDYDGEKVHYKKKFKKICKKVLTFDGKKCILYIERAIEQIRLI